MSPGAASAILNTTTAAHLGDFDIMTCRALRRHTDTPVLSDRCKSLRTQALQTGRVP